MEYSPASSLVIEDRYLGGNNVEAYYCELENGFRGMAVDPQIEPERRRVWEMVAAGMECVPRPARRRLGYSPAQLKGFIFFGPEGPHKVYRPGASRLAARSISEVIEEMEPSWAAAVEQARYVGDDPAVLAAWSEIPIEAVLAVLEDWQTRL